MNDSELLTRYARTGAGDAFGELVSRYVDMVYSAALRQTQNPHDAEDVTQAVFTALAGDAVKLQKHPVLAGWLMTATRFQCSHLRQSRSRRQQHERNAAQQAQNMITPEPTDPDWRRLASDLDEAIGELAPRARDAVLLRYFQNKSVREVAGTLGISEDAAKRRLSRGLEQLRALFSRRGITLSSVTLATLLTAHSVHAAPSELAATVTTASVKSAVSITLQKGSAGFMSSMIGKVTLAGIVSATLLGTSAVIHRTLARPPAEKPLLLAANLQAAAAGDDSWRKRFDDQYRLDDAKVLRRIPPPFIPERAAYFHKVDPSGQMFDPTEDGMTVFAWRDGKADLDLWVRGSPSVGTVLGSMIGIPRYKIEMKLADRLRPAPGDWVVHKEEPEEKKMAALAEVFRTELKWGVHFDKREAERDAIIASGEFKAPKREGNPDGAFDIYVSSKRSRGMGAGNRQSLLRALGELGNIELIDEATGGDNGVFWRNNTDDNLSAQDMDMMLSHITEQTGLKFKRARKVTSHWVAVADDKPKS